MKLGTAVVLGSSRENEQAHFDQLVADLANGAKLHPLVIVSSGARELGRRAGIEDKYAAGAAGQKPITEMYRQAFAKHGIECGGHWR